MRYPLILAALAVLTVSCAKKEAPPAPPAPTENPFLTEWTTPFGTPPFDQIKPAHYMPAYEAGMAAQKERSRGRHRRSRAPDLRQHHRGPGTERPPLTKVDNVFFNLTSRHTNEEMQKIEQEVAPLLSKHEDDIILDPKLFARVKAIEDGKAQLTLTPEQACSSRRPTKSSSAAAPTSTRPRRPSSGRSTRSCPS